MLKARWSMSCKKQLISGRNRAAFTLVELLVVIGIIALLISILLPALTKAKRNALQIKCAANLHNYGLAILNYTVDNKGKLPQFFGDSNNLTNAPEANPPYWLWDMEIPTRNALVHYGAIRNTMYCPRNFDEMNVNGLWDFRVEGPAATVSTPTQFGLSVTGYGYLIARTDSANMPSSDTIPPGVSLTAANAAQYKWNYQTTTTPNNTRYPPAAVSMPQARPNDASRTELVFDDTISTLNDRTNPAFSRSFGNITGSYQLNGVYVTHQTAHWYGSLPVGGNILFMDGHGEWRPFSAMKCRTEVAGNIFWWW
jgi:prepilin-type N-terminal cleavage/methylation domain-containing protein/prepilin-type processing-associated H-X9-DG protein